MNNSDSRTLNLLDNSWRCCDPSAFLSALTESLGSGWAIAVPNGEAPWIKLSLDRMPAASGATGDTPTILARAIATCLAYLVTELSSAKRARSLSATAPSTTKIAIHIIMDLRCTPLISLQALLRKRLVEKVVAVLLEPIIQSESSSTSATRRSLQELVAANASALHFVVVPPRGPLYDNLSLGSAAGTAALHSVLSRLRREVPGVDITATSLATITRSSSQSPHRDESPTSTAPLPSSPAELPATIRAALDLDDDGQAFVDWWNAMLHDTNESPNGNARSDSAPRSASRGTTTTDSGRSRSRSLSSARERSPMQDRHVNAALHLLRDHEVQCRQAIEAELEGEVVRFQFWLRHEASCFAHHFIPHIAGKVSHDHLRLETVEVQARHNLVHSEAEARLALAELREDDAERLALWITRRNALLRQEAVVRDFQRSQEVRQGDVLFAFVADRLRELHALYPPIEPPPPVVTDDDNAREDSVNAIDDCSDATVVVHANSAPSSPEVPRPKTVTDDPLQMVPVLSSLSLPYRRSISREAVTYHHARHFANDTKQHIHDAGAPPLQDF